MWRPQWIANMRYSHGNNGSHIKSWFLTEDEHFRKFENYPKANKIIDKIAYFKYFSIKKKATPDDNVCWVFSYATPHWQGFYCTMSTVKKWVLHGQNTEEVIIAAVLRTKKPVLTWTKHWRSDNSRHFACKQTNITWTKYWKSNNHGHYRGK